MSKDIGRYTIHTNRHYLSDFAFGFDYYQYYSYTDNIHEASVLQLNFLFFNITITRWTKWI